METQGYISQVVCKVDKVKLIRSGVVMEELLVQVDGRGNLVQREGLGQSELACYTRCGR
jgi:hypothetical protein